jgi:hypothetical protein
MRFLKSFDYWVSFLALSLTTAALSGAPAFAGDGANSGGGGSSVVCFDSLAVLSEVEQQQGALTHEQIRHIESIETYDLMQARAWKSFGTTAGSLFLPLPNESAEAYFERLARRFDRTVPLISDLIRQAKDNLHKAGMMTAWEGGVVQRRDANPAIKWDDTRCTLVTTAYQYAQGTRLMVALDGRLLEHPKNSGLSRYFLYLHEGLYSIARARGQVDSRSTRDLISQIMQLEIPMSAGELSAYAVGLGFADASITDRRYAETWVSDSSQPVPHAFYTESLPAKYLNAHTYNERVVVGALEEMSRAYWRLIIRYDAANQQIVNAMGSGIDDDDEARSTTRAYAFYFKARDQWVTSEFKRLWARKRAELANLPDLARRSLQILDGVVVSNGCRGEVKWNSSPVQTTCEFGSIALQDFADEAPAITPSRI